MASQFLRVDVRYRKIRGLNIKMGSTVRAIAKELAELSRAKAERGSTAGGKQLPPAKARNQKWFKKAFPNYRPMNRTGMLAGSIKHHKAAKKRRRVTFGRKKRVLLESDTLYLVGPHGPRDKSITITRASGKKYTRNLTNLAVHAINAKRGRRNVMDGHEKLHEKASAAGKKAFARAVRQARKNAFRLGPARKVR